MANQEYESFSGKLDAAPEFEPFSGALDGEKDSNPFRSLGDSAIALGTGITQGIGMLANVAGADNAVSRTMGDATKALSELESPYRKAEKQERARKIEEAEKSGSTLNEVGAYLGAFAEAPIDTTLNALGTSLPTIAAGFIPGAGQAALLARGAQLGLGAAQGVGAVKGQIFDEVQQAWKKQGATDEDAAARATQAQSYTGDNAGSIALGGALGAVAGMTGAEASVRRMASNQLAERAAQAGVLKGMGMGALKESPMEMLQGGQEKLSSNLALQNEGFDQPAWQGVAGSAALEGVAGGAMGAGFGAMEARGQQRLAQLEQQRRAEIEQQLQNIPEHQQPAARAQLNAELNAQMQAEARAAGLLDEEMGAPDVPTGNPNDYRATPAWAKPPEDAAPDYASADDEIFQSTGTPQRVDPVREAVRQAADAGGALSAAAGVAMDSGAAPTFMPPEVAEQPQEPQPEPVVLQNRDRTSAASIAQMQEIAAAPDYMRAGPSREMATGAPVVFGDLPGNAALGRQEVVVDGRGGRVQAQYAVVDAADVIASNNADGTTVSEYANGLPGKLRAVAGNGRTAGLQAAYQQGTANNYAQELLNDAGALGIDPQAVASIQRPVLVRVMGQSDVTADMGDRTNITSTQKLSPVEQAANDSRRFSVESLSFDEQGNPTAQSIGGFVSSMPVAERGDMLNPDGTPTRQAVDRLMAATFKQAYDSDELVQLHAQATDPDARSVLAAAADASGVMAALRGTGDFDVRGAVTDAVKMAVNAARQGLKLSDVLQNADFDMNPEAYPVATFLAQNIRSPKAIAEGLRRWGQLALQNARTAEENQYQGGLLGPAPTLSRAELFARIGDAYNPTEQAVAGRMQPQQPQAEQAAIEPAQPAPMMVPGNYTGTPSATIGTRMDAVAGPGFGATDLQSALAQIRARKQQTQQPTETPTNAATPINNGTQAAPTTSAQGQAPEQAAPVAPTWAAMPAEARQQVAQAAGLNPVQTAKALASGSIEEMPAAVAAKLEPVLATPAAPALTTYTPAEIEAQQAQQEQAAKAKAASQRAEAQAATAADDRKRIAAASVAAADSFELGQDPMDSITGQKDVFADAPEATENAANDEKDGRAQQPMPAFDAYNDAMDWAKARAKSMGMSFIAYRSTDEFKNGVSQQLESLYKTHKAKWDADTAEAGKAMQAAMAQAGIRPGDTVEWVQSGAFLSQDRMSGVVRLDSNGVPQVHMGSEIAVAKPGGKIGYTKKLRWQDYMKKSGEAGKREQNQPVAPANPAQAATENVAVRLAKDEIPGESSALAAKQRWEQAKADEVQQPAPSANDRPASWFVVDKSTGEIVMETSNKAAVDALNTSKYEAFEAYDYLAGLNRSIKRLGDNPDKRRVLDDVRAAAEDRRVAKLYGDGAEQLATPAQAATENIALDVLERKTDEVMANVVAPGSVNLTRDQVRALIQEKGVAAADKTIADYQEHVAKQTESIRKYSDRKEAASQSSKAPTATASQTPAEPNPLEHTPKQYADAWLRWSAETNGLPLAEVREMQGDEAGLKAIEQRWVDAAVQEARNGKPLPAKTLDKLLEVRPNTTLPESAIPDGYQRPEARKAEKEEAAARKAKPTNLKEGIAQAQTNAQAKAQKGVKLNARALKAGPVVAAKANQPATPADTAQAATETVAPFESSGIKIVPVKLRGTAGIKWEVHGPEGNSILATREEAIQRAAEDANRAQANAKSRSAAQVANQKKLEAASDRNSEANDIDGFMSNAAQVVRDRAIKTLNTSTSSNGILTTRKALIRERVANGAKVTQAKEGRRLVMPSGTYLAESDITKTAMNYAEHLIAKAQEATETVANKAPAKEDAASTAPADLDAMFDDLMAETAPVAPTPRAPRATAPKPRTATQAAASAVKNTAAALNNAIDGLGALFGAKSGGRMGSGLSFDENTYAQAKPLFIQAVSSLKNASADIREAMRAVIQMVTAKFGREVTENMKPYIVRFASDVRDGTISQEELNAPSTDARLERDSNEPATEPAVVPAVPGDAGAVSGNAGRTGGQAAGAAGRGQPGDSGVPAGGTAADGERGDFRVSGGDAAADAARIAAGSDFSERGSDIGVDGVSADPIPAAKVDAAASKPLDRLAKTAQQREAEKVPVKPGDLDNIKATLPYLLEGQQEDVLKTETRFAKPDGYGMLFTNGTGTGKTFTGLGVVKRMQRQGKNSVLIVVPDDKIAADWVESGVPLGLSISKLQDTKSAGSGIVITTYANLGDNDALARRQWDMVVADEAHTLMQSADGTVTGYLANLRAITHHPDGAYQRHTMLNRKDIDALAKLSEQIQANNKILNNTDTVDAMMASVRAENEQLQKEADALAKKLSEASDAVRAEVAEMQGAKRTRLLALSATPFAYEFTVDWANGYLFDYNEGQASDRKEFRGYNQGSNKDRFFMANFGYTMRYNKLTKPDPTKVDTGLLQRNFNVMLRKSGALSSRMLDVPADYDRRFVLVDSGIGNQIDDALNWISEQRRGAEQGNMGYATLADLINDKFDYLSRRYLLEAIKATEVVPIVRQHMAMGRKVVVFHDYKKGGGFNPFNIKVPGKATEGTSAENAQALESLRNAVIEFRAKFKELVEAPLGELDSPIEVFKREFADVLLVNGDEKKAALLERYKRFQDDASGPQVMLVQSAKNKGWSGHDTTGKHQRVLINLGQPTAPTMAIQQEGRIYRTGQVTDAIMRYLNTGTSWERMTFAQTIAGRASAAENLGMGEQARALKDSFINAFEESDTYAPGHEGEGKGGKERDKMDNATITAFDRAKTYYWGSQKKTSKTKAQEGKDYFATPEPLGLKMAEWLDLRGSESALEPSAGHGAIARWLPETANRTAIEPSNTLRARLALAMDASKDRLIDGTFEDHAIVNKYDGIVMNPPFGVGGKTAIEHLDKAVKHLRDGGRIVALIPTGPAADKRFDQWMNGESERPTKPLYIDPNHGPIYKGDTLTITGFGTLRTIVVDKVDGPANGPRYVRDANTSPDGAINITAINKVEPTGPRTETYRASDGIYTVAEIKLPQVTFERAGTAVATRIVIFEKQNDASRAPNPRAPVDLTSIADINKLFDRIENMNVQPRAMTAEQEAAEKASKTSEAKASKADAAPATQPKAPKAANPAAVGTVDRGGAKVITHTTGAGKTIHGIVKTDWTLAQARAVDPYTFKKNGGFFIREAYLKPEGDTANYAATNPTRPGTAQDKAVMQAIADGKNARDVLRLIASGSKDPFRRQVARLLLKSGITPNIEFGHIGKTKNGTPIYGQYRGKTDTIAIADNAEYAAERIFMHEALHAATMRALAKGGLARVQLQKLMAHVQKQNGAAGFYGMQNVDEFVAEVFTNPDFQNALRGMSAPAGNSLKSAWDSFVRILRGILGLPNDSLNALSQALELGVEAVRQDMVLRKQGAQAGRNANAGRDAERAVGDATPAEAQRVQSAIEGGSLLDAARFLTRSNDKARAAVAQKVLEKLERLEQAGVALQLHIVHRGDMAPAAMANARGYTETGFDSKGRDVAVWLNGADVAGKVGTEEEVLLHELVHATTTGMVFYGRNRPDSLAGKHVRDLMAVTDAIASHITQRFADAAAGKLQLTEFEQDMRAGANNAFRSDDEVLAWALTNAEAQQYLESIPYKSGTLWSSFVQSVRSLLGLSPSSDTALSEVLRAADRLLTDDAPDAGRAAFWHKRGLRMVQQQGHGSRVFINQANARSDAIDQTETENFKRWLKDSKVVDAEGKPLVVYHGTNADFSKFDVAKSKRAAFGLGFYFTSAPNSASQVATVDSSIVMPVYLSITNPASILDFYHAMKEVNSDQFSSDRQVDSGAEITKNLISKGFDGVIIGDDFVVFRPEQIKSATGNNGNFDPEDPDIRNFGMDDIRNAINERKTVIAGQTSRAYTPEQQAAMRNVGLMVEQPSLKERAQALWQDAGKKLAQGIVDQFAPVKEISKDAYALLRLSKGASGAFETLLKGGKLKLSGGVYDFDEANKGGVVDALLTPLNGEHHDFLRWVAANRAERLMGEDRERLFTPDDIAALKTLADGQLSSDFTLKNGPRKGQITRSRAEAYKDSLATFNAFNKNVLDMAEQSGLIDKDSRATWESEFYVPFYRVADEESGGVRGMNIKGSVVRQQAFKHLKGGKQALNNDLLDNTLMNWAHLLDASAKNRAAKATLEAAQQVGVAIEAPKGTLDNIASAIGKKNGIVWFMDEGQKRHFMVDDPYIMTAISSLEYAGMNSPIMNAMSAFKHALTIGVTASPFFKIRNLIRDSVQVVGTSSIGVNPLKNVAEGWKLTDPKNDAYFRLLAGGGTIHFGTMLEGSEAKRVQALVESGVQDSTILSTDHKVKQFYRKYIEPGITAYNELGNRGEAVNRAALYDQLRKQGMGHAEASLQARDLMDFSMQGSFTSIRFLSQVVPFLNARLQGMYKLGRAANENPKRMAYVTGAVAMASLALLAAYGDDDDWKRREDWDRNNFWWFKVGGVAFRIPKPFELGAIGTLAERSAEYLMDDEMTGKRFRGQVLKLLGDNLSMNPIPQAVKPILDVYANKDSFRNAPIESMGMERMKSEYRFNDRTSMVARGLSTAANSVTGLVGAESLSPVQIDHLLRGYFGWLGTFAVGTADMIARPVTNQPTQATQDIWKKVTGGIVSELQDAPSRYVSSVYDQAKELEQAFGTWRALQKSGKPEEAAAFFADNREEIARYRSVTQVKSAESKLNERIRQIERNEAMDGDQKREEIRRIRAMKEALAKSLAPA